MLAKPEINIHEITKLADFIDKLEPGRFDMGTWGRFEEPRCICGWLLQLKALPDKEDWMHAGAILGLTPKQASHLFKNRPWDNHQAARALRTLAATGDLDNDLTPGLACVGEV